MLEKSRVSTHQSDRRQLFQKSVCKVNDPGVLPRFCPPRPRAPWHVGQQGDGAAVTLTWWRAGTLLPKAHPARDVLPEKKGGCLGLQRWKMSPWLKNHHLHVSDYIEGFQSDTRVSERNTVYWWLWEKLEELYFINFSFISVFFHSKFLDKYLPRAIYLTINWTRENPHMITKLNRRVIMSNFL